MLGFFLVQIPTAASAAAHKAGGGNVKITDAPVKFNTGPKVRELFTMPFCRHSLSPTMRAHFLVFLFTYISAVLAAHFHFLTDSYRCICRCSQGRGRKCEDH
jgi:hypothetical protein